MSAVAEQTTAVPTGTWSIDPAHSSVEFQVKHLGIATVKGRAPVVRGTIEGPNTCYCLEPQAIDWLKREFGALSDACC